jgi:hypothetical protein
MVVGQKNFVGLANSGRAACQLICINTEPAAFA